MRRVFQMGICRGLIAASVMAWGLARAQTSPPAALFFESPSFIGAQLAPSGQHVAFVVGSKEHRDRLAVLDLQTMKVQTVAALEDSDVTFFRWVNDRRLILHGGDKRRAPPDRVWQPYLLAVNADGSGYRRLSQLSWGQLLGSADAQSGDHVLMVRGEAQDFSRLYRVNTNSPHLDELDAPVNANQWLIDAGGELRAVRTARNDRATLQWREPTSGQWRQLREFDRYTGGSLSLLAVLPDQQLLVSARRKDDTAALYRYDPATDRLADQPLLAVQGFDVLPHQLIWREDRLAGVRFTADAEVTVWFDDDMKALQADIDQRFPATANLLTPPRRGDSPWLLVRSFSEQQPGVYHVFNRVTRKLTRLGERMPAVKAEQMSPMDFLRYPARDGLEIPAYLTLPAASATKKNLPLIVYAHGGPWVRGTQWTWQAEVQFLASRGYAVLQPEFRGSLGFGAKLFRAGFKQWGQAMQNDLADGARWAIAKGIADPKRICIMGASYGGYATLMGLVKDPELYRCGVSWVGVSDILLMYDARWSDLPDEWKQFGMPQLIGDRDKDIDMLRANSPLQQAARIRNPLLVGHGRLDRRVPVEHGRSLVDAVKPHNPDVEWVEYDKEGHGWSLPETDLDWWTRVERFLARHIPARP